MFNQKKKKEKKVFSLYFISIHQTILIISCLKTNLSFKCFQHMFFVDWIKLQCVLFRPDPHDSIRLVCLWGSGGEQWNQHHRKLKDKLLWSFLKFWYEVPLWSSTFGASENSYQVVLKSSSVGVCFHNITSRGPDND